MKNKTKQKQPYYKLGSYLCTIQFHNQRPSTSAACAKAGHVTKHINRLRANFEWVGSVLFGPGK